MNTAFYKDKNLWIYLLKFGLVFCILYYGTLAIIGLASPVGWYSPTVQKYFDYVSWIKMSLIHATGFILSWFHIPTETEPESEDQFNFVEAVIPANSGLVGMRIKDSDFRKKFDSSIIAIHRNGKRVPGKVGEMQISAGDFLLLLSNDRRDHASDDDSDLFFLSVPKKIKETKSK